MRRGVPLRAISMAVCVMLIAPAAWAQRSRPRFEPTDLDLHEEGTAEIDLQVGALKGNDYVRAFAPDLEMSIGIARAAELEIDTTFGLNHFRSAEFLDNTLVALRVGMLDAHDAPGSPNAWALGVQIGPRLPTLPGSRGFGLEALAIVGRSAGRLHVFLQAGTLVDCAQLDDTGAKSPRPTAIEFGASADLDLDDHDAWSLKADLGGAKFFSPDDPQLQLVAGPALNVAPAFEVSAAALVGFLRGGDRVGLLVGAATHFKSF